MKSASFSAVLILVTAILAGAVNLSASMILADEVPSGSALKYRRVLVPEDHVTDWPSEGQKFLPIEKDEFHRLLAESGDPAPGTTRPRETYIAKADYVASLSRETLTGSGVFDVVHGASGPSMVPLSPCSLAIHDAAWDESPESSSAIVARSGAPALLQVSRSGRVRLKWSLRGARDASGVLNFSLSMPRSTTTRLTLELPKDTAPLPDHGIITSAEVSGERGRYVIEINGHRPLVLKLVERKSALTMSALNLVRQEVKYEFASDAVEVTAQLRIDAVAQPQHELQVVLDAPLQLAGAKYGELTLRWTSIEAGENSSTYTITLPEPLSGSGRIIHLAAVGPLVQDRLWSLPQIQCQSMLWQEGHSTLIIPQPLLLKQLVTRNCRQAQAGALLAPASGERVEVQCFAPNAQIDVHVGQADARTQLSSGILLELGTKSTTATIKAAFSSKHGEEFLLQADVSRHWGIESVSTLPADALLDWSSNSTSRNKGALTVRLAKAVKADRPVTLIVTARRRGVSMGEPLAIDDLRVLNFSGVQMQRQLLALSHAGPHRIEQISPAEIRDLDAKMLTADDLALFADPPAGRLYRLASHSESLRIALTEQPPRFSSDIQVHVTVNGQEFTESYVFRCNPENTALERLQIHFSEAAPEEFTWSSGEADVQIQAKRLTETAGSSQGETWEVALGRPMADPVELRAERKRTLNIPRAIGLAALPNSTTQSGRVSIRSTGDIAPVISSRLRLTAAPAIPPDEYSTNLGTYSYSPARDAWSPSEDAIVLTASSSKVQRARAWAWKCRHNASIFADGSIQHEVLYLIENAGRDELKLQFPRDAVPSMVLISGVRVSMDDTDGEQGVTVKLPTTRRFPWLTVRYSTNGRTLGLTSSVAIAPPTLDVPIASRQLILASPPGYELTDSDARLWNMPRVATWSERLFAGTGRVDFAERFDPFAEQSWRGIVSGEHDQSRADRELEQFLTEFGQHVVAAQRTPADVLTWGEAISYALYPDDRTADAVLVRLFADRAALNEVGVRPSTPVPVGSHQNFALAASSVLTDAGLAIIETDIGLVLTSRSYLAAWPARVEASRHASAFIAHAAGLLRGDGDPNALIDPRFVDVLSWLAEADVENLAAKGYETRHSGHRGFDWNIYRIDIAGEDHVAVRMADLETIRTGGWCLFLIAAALSWWLCRGRYVPKLLMVSLVGLMCLLAPVFLVPLTSLGFIGMIFGLLCQAVTPPTLGKEPELTAKRPASTFARIPAGIGAAILLFAGLPSDAEEPGTSDLDPTSFGAYKILVPINADQEPSGSTYYVPEPFYRELYRRAQGIDAYDRGPLFLSANYLIRRKPEPTDATQAGLQLQAEFEVQIAQGRSELNLTIGGKSAEVASGGVHVDGVDSKFQWDAATGELKIPDVEPGVRQLRVLLDLTTVSHDGISEIQTAIPPVATATLSGLLPMLPDLSVPSARGSVTVAAKDGTVYAQLGPSNRIVVRWVSSAIRTAARSVFDVEELHWLNIKPGSVVINARFKLAVIEGVVGQLRIASDPRIRLLPTSGTSLISAVRSSAGEPIVVDLSRPVTDQATIDLSFLVTGSSGIGNLQLPKIEVLDARTTTRMVAISLDQLLKETFSGILDAVPVDAFLKSWGSEEKSPIIAAFRVPPDGTSPTISVQPRAPELTEQQRLALIVARDRIDVRFETQLTTTGGNRFQYNLRTPEGFRVHAAQVLQDGVERTVNWLEDGDGSIVVRLSQTSSGSQTLMLRGTLQRPEQNKWPIPQFKLEDSLLESKRVQVFRTSDMLVELSGQPVENGANNPQPDSTESFPTISGDSERQPIFVGQIKSGREETPVILAIKRNRPVVRAQLVTSMQNIASSWNGIAHVQLDVSDGLVDSLVFDIGDHWSGALDVIPATETETLVGAGNRRQLVIRPAKPIAGEFQLTLQGALKFRDGESVRAPEITLRNASELVRYLALPTRHEGRQLFWEPRGIRPLPIPADLLAAIDLRGPIAGYQIVSDQFQAVLGSIEKSGGRPEVRLVKTEVTCQPDGRFTGIARFDLQPAGLASCALHLPDGCELIDVAIDERPAAIQPLAPSQFSVDLAQNHLPMELTVLYSGVSAGNHTTAHSFQTPILAGLPVIETLWKVQIVGAHRAAPDATAAINALQHVTIDWKAALDLLDSSIDPSADQSKALVQQALDRLVARCNRLQSVLSRATGRLEASEMKRNTEAELAALNERQSKIYSRLGIDAARRLPAASAAPADRDITVHGGNTATVLSWNPAGASELTVQLRPAPRSQADPLLPMLALLMLGLASAVPATRRAAHVVWTRWPFTFGILLGVIWWLWLVPSALGLVIILLSTVAAVRTKNFLPREPRTRRIGAEM